METSSPSARHLEASESFAAMTIEPNQAAAYEPVTWHLAQCFRCDPDFAQPFTDDTERDLWATTHVANTGHVVKVSAERSAIANAALPHSTAMTLPHSTAMLSLDPSEGWRYVCTGEGCGSSQGPYETGRLALASHQGHTAKATR
jgi:hypothetical protein